MLRQISAFIALPLIASCTGPQATSTTVVTPPPVVAPPPIPQSPSAPIGRYAGDWSVDDVSTGEWRYSRAGGIASASFRGDDGTVHVVIACGANSISIGRTGTVPAETAVNMQIRTSFALRELSVRVDRTARLIYSSTDVRDPLWGQIAYSRGRFLIETTALPALIVPTGPEITRVVEDCQG